MEYVVVSYPTTRKVRIDGQDAGFTNDTLMVETGNHLFDLGDPRDYQPAPSRRSSKARLRSVL